jgi:uncharacterized protein
VDTPHLLANITDTPLGELVLDEQQREFAEAKRDTLPRYRLECDFLVAYNGECPKNRLLLASDGEPGLNWFREGLKYRVCSDR